MISSAYITEWQKYAPWKYRVQIEQDLILSRVLCDIFSVPELQSQLAFRGGTALNKLHLPKPARYSEDIDFVQVNAGGVGTLINSMRAILDPWLGTPKRKFTAASAKLHYQFQGSGDVPTPLRLKIEINTREHFSLFGFIKEPFSVTSSWYSNEVRVMTYRLPELLGTKMRALFQRKKGRDLFDVWYLTTTTDVDCKEAFEAFTFYNKKHHRTISHNEFIKNLEEKRDDRQFRQDMMPLLSPGLEYDFENAHRHVISLIKKFYNV